MEIVARAYSDDHRVEVTFDATPWWDQATDQQKQALRDCNWGGDYAADTVAIYMADHDKEVKRMFSYINIVGDVGFECHVEPVDDLPSESEQE